MTTTASADPLAPSAGHPSSARRDLYIALILGLLIALASAVKPIGIDDLAYYEHGMHAAAHPLDPLGYNTRVEGNWHETAFRLPCPPVVQYWLAIGYRFIGDNVFLIKLWMGPWAILLTWCFLRLARPWTGAWALPATAAVLLTPIVFNGLNIMLDIPAAALVLASVLVFRAYLDDPKSPPAVLIAAGLITGLAMQTKYSAFFAPVAILALAIAYHRPWVGLIPGIIGGGLFWLWELFLILKYGQSHLIYLSNSNYFPPERALAAWSLLGLPGTGALALLLLAAAASGFRVWAVALLGIACTAGYICVFFIQDSMTCLAFIAGGLLYAILAFGAAKTLRHPASRPDQSRITWFLIAWVAIEAIQVIAVSPFPAGRRVMVMVIVMGLLIGRFGHVLAITPKRSLIAAALALALPMTAITWYADLKLAQNMRSALLDARDNILRADPKARIYYMGLWSWQYYGPRSGMLEAQTNRTVLEPGDWLIFPEFGMLHQQVALNPQNYGLNARMPSDPGMHLSFLPNYCDWVSIAYVPNRSIVVLIAQSTTRHVPEVLISSNEMLAMMSIHKTPLPIASTLSLMRLGQQSPDPFHNPFADALVKWGEPWLAEGVNHPLPADAQYARELVTARKNDLPPGVAEKLLSRQP